MLEDLIERLEANKKKGEDICALLLNQTLTNVSHNLSPQEETPQDNNPDTDLNPEK